MKNLLLFKSDSIGKEFCSLCFFKEKEVKLDFNTDAKAKILLSVKLSWF